MISGDGWGLRFPDICLSVEEKIRKEPQPGKLTRPGIEPEPAACYSLRHSGGLGVTLKEKNAILYMFIKLLLLGFTTHLNILGHQRRFRQIERCKADKFCSEALISAWGSFTCRKSTTRDTRLYFPSIGSHTQDFDCLKIIHRPRLGSNPRTSHPEASIITPRPPGSPVHEMEHFVLVPKIVIMILFYIFTRVCCDFINYK